MLNDVYFQSIKYTNFGEGILPSQTTFFVDFLLKYGSKLNNLSEYTPGTINNLSVKGAYYIHTLRNFCE